MEDDDEFGDLYTDVLRPLQARPEELDAPPSALGRPIDPNAGRGEEVTIPGLSFNLKLNSSTQEKTLPHGGSDLNLDSSSRTGGRAGSKLEGSGVSGKDGEEKLRHEGSNLLEDDGLDIVVEGMDNNDGNGASFMPKEDDRRRAVDRIGDSVNLMDQGSDQAIPGLSRKLENHGGFNLQDDWESDESEDDLEIVLNDNDGGLMGIERMKGLNGEGDDEGGALANDGDMAHHLHHQQMMMDEQEWGGEEGGPGVDAEKKVLGDATKPEGGVAGTAAVPLKIGFSNHAYHHPLHSQFKYVRPGAAPIPGAAPVTSGGVQGQARPPISLPPVAGRGRGDWRPSGIRGPAPMQKGFHPNYGAPISSSIAGRGYGSGLDFTLPSHRTIFEIDIDGFEDKPWKLPGIDASDFFNFGLNEESWKSYCKQLEQLRLETTMQSKIRVYESNRADQGYDPDLPPELAAAVGNNDFHSENAKLEANSSDLARAALLGRPPPIPIGRPIPVETGSADRLSSMDTRRLRLHDSDTIIEIICQNPVDEKNEMADQENNTAGENRELIDGADDLPSNGSGHFERSSYRPNARKKDVPPPTRRANHRNTNSPSAADGGHLRSDSEGASPRQIDRETGTTISQRSANERGHAKPMNATASRNSGEIPITDETADKPLRSSSQAMESEAEHAATTEDEVNYKSVVDDRSQGSEKEDRPIRPTSSDVHSDEKLMSKKRARSQVEQVSQDNEQDSKAAKPRSGSIKDIRKSGENLEEEVLHDKHGAHARSLRRGSEDNAEIRNHRGKEGSGRHHVVEKGRGESNSRRRDDPSILAQRQMKSVNTDSRKEADVSEGSRRRRDEDLHGRRAGVEDTRRRDHGGEISSRSRSTARDRERSEKGENYQSRSQMDRGAWRGADHDQDIGPKQRHRENDAKFHSDEVNDFNDKRKKDGAYASREQVEKGGKKERNDGSDQWKREDVSKSRDDGLHHVRKIEERSAPKERDGRPRGRRELNRSEENSSRKEREMQTDMKSGRPVEDKSLPSRSRGKDNYGKDGNHKDAGRHGVQVKRKDRSESEKISQQDVQTRQSQVSNDEKRRKYERTHASDSRSSAYASDEAKLQEHQKDSRRKSKEREGGEQKSLVNSQRNHDELNGQIGQTVSSGAKKAGQKGASKKPGEEASSDDETGSKRGRSKLERWTSQKERDFGTANAQSSSLRKSKAVNTNNNSGTPLDQRPPEEPPQKPENKPENDKEANAKAKSEDKHLDTVEKLKKRRERFKLPMPGEKDSSAAVKKMEADILPPAPAEHRQDSEIKPERPPRKRRWTGN